MVRRFTAVSDKSIDNSRMDAVIQFEYPVLLESNDKHAPTNLQHVVLYLIWSFLHVEDEEDKVVVEWLKLLPKIMWDAGVKNAEMTKVFCIGMCAC